MAAVIFPQENATNPDTGRPYNEGWLNPDNNIVYVYENGAWKAATTGESNAVLDSRYVEVEGDNMTGPLTLGGTSINLQATDGSASFAGDVSVGSPSTTAKLGVQSGTTGWTGFLRNTNTSGGGLLIETAGELSTTTAFKVRPNGGTDKVVVSADGSASFAGEVTFTGDTINGIYFGDPGIAASPAGGITMRRRIIDGNIEASGNQLYIYNSKETETAFAIQTAPDGATVKDTKIALNNDGSASFASHVGFGTTAPLSTTGYIGPTASGSTGGVYWMAKNSGQVGYLAGTTNLVSLAATETGGVLRFLTGGNNERVKIDSSGRATFFNSNVYNTVIRSSLAASRDNAFLGCTSNNTNIDGAGDGTIRFQIFTNGDAENVNGVFAAISDATLKENIVPATSQWSDIKGIEVVNYNFKEETGHETHKQLGVIAQQVEKVCPGLVNTKADGLKSVNYSVLYMKSVKALQEAIARIESLEESNANLLERISALEAQ